MSGVYKYRVEPHTASCCGVTEWGSFLSDHNTHQTYFDGSKYDSYSPDCYIYANTPQEFVEKIMDHPEANGFLNHIHFIRKKKYDGTLEENYEWDEVRQAIQTIPGIMPMGTFINPNTGNEVDSYCWLNTREPHKEDDDDEYENDF